MQRRVVKGEIWLGVPGWPYQVGSYGHLRRKRSRKLINPGLDSDGYAIAILQSGSRHAEFYLDALVASAFSGQKADGVRPLHLNGLPWDNWSINLGWGIGGLPYGNMTNLVTNWTVWNAGKLQHGPFTDHQVTRTAARCIGDLIIGRNPKREIVAVEIKWSLAMPPLNPFDLVRKYKALAAQHSNQFWSLELSEAAEVITALASQAVERVSPPTGLARAQTASRTAEATNGAGFVQTATASPQAVPAMPRRPMPAAAVQPLTRRVPNKKLGPAA